jgi:hypothetical protein
MLRVGCRFNCKLPICEERSRQLAKNDMNNIIDIQTAEPQNFDEIASLNIEAYREYAKYLSDEG